MIHWLASAFIVAKEPRAKKENASFRDENKSGLSIPSSPENR
jgi:hypothetical protein